MSSVTIYHNPKCSKSRGALALLEERGVAHETVRYLDEPPSRAALAEILRCIGGDPGELVRSGDSAFRQAGLELSASPGVDEVLDILVGHPELMQRPVVIAGDRGVIARPPDRLLELLCD